ncbi:helix-turn-helix domain-containing protein [Mycobacteroides chelonae]|uniref:helix-turn-helix domain-containing protein n=1 Tax=Mycobacteroides chelonae TaxID=1774 RepID=UPI0004AAA484|nr:helix-turn-helix domain-containing protein [Mycobacteroides chelonae]
MSLLELTELKAENARLRGELDALKKPNNRKKLTVGEVNFIRLMYRNRGFNQREIADIYDINPATVSRIVRRIYHKEAA